MSTSPIKSARFLQSVFIGGALLFLVWRAHSDFSKLPQFEWEFRLVEFIGATLLAICAYCSSALLWAGIARQHGASGNLNGLLRIWFDSLVAKYLPGGFWNLVGRAYLCKTGEKMEGRAAVSSIALEQALAIGAQIVLVLLLSPAYLSASGTLPPKYAYLGFVIALILMVIYPSLISWGLRQIRERFDFPLHLSASKLNRTHLWMLLYLLLHSVGGLAYYLFFDALYPLPLSLLPGIILVVNAALLSGLIVPLAPAGLGIREGALILLLGTWIPSPVAMALALAARLWIVPVELLCFLGARLAFEKEQNQQRYPHSSDSR
jgi:glycosyltransferase 2 family protein